jgi:hypothetical protein
MNLLKHKKGMDMGKAILTAFEMLDGKEYMADSTGEGVRRGSGKEGFEITEGNVSVRYLSMFKDWFCSDNVPSAESDWLCSDNVPSAESDWL